MTWPFDTEGGGKPPPPAMADEELLLILAEAVQHPCGVAVRTNAPERLRQKLYPAMKQADVHFQLVIPKAEGELWLIPKDKKP